MPPRPRAGILPAILCLILLSLGGCEWTGQRAFEVTIDLVAEGEPIQLTRRIMCEGPVRFGPDLVPMDQWRPTALAFGAALPSGAAVMVRTPAFCRYAFDWAAADATPLVVPNGHIPLIGWTDKATDPTVVEIFVSKEYFEQPAARVRFLSMSARRIDSSSAKRGPVDAFDWFGEPYKLGLGYHATIVERADWNALAPVAAYVVNVDDVEMLPDDLTLLFSKKYKAYDYPGGTWASGVRGTPDVDDSGRSYLLDEAVRRLANVRPLFRDEDAFSIQPSQMGYFVYYQTLRREYRQERLPPENPLVRFRFGRRSIDIPLKRFEPFAIYDPHTKQIAIVKMNLVVRRLGSTRHDESNRVAKRF